MDNKTQDDKQKQMPWFAFKVMTLIMSVRKKFRNIEEEIGLAGINEGDYILDFGCGLGFNTILAAQKVKEQGKVYALDINPQSIKMVKNKSSKNKLENIETILSDCDTCLEDRSVDIVYLHNTLPLVKNKQQVLNEIHRVLKVGGRLSYMSRTLSRAAGENTMSDGRLKEVLKADYTLIKEKNAHLIFEKLENKNA
jgi:ubiquinone/menaquinone biosynthesis C-methylase UbiE